MKRIFGFRKKKKGKNKERLSPPDDDYASPHTPAAMMVDGGDGDGAAGFSSPMYQYAKHEFAQTVGAGTSNDDGKGILYVSPSDTPSRLFANNSDNDTTNAAMMGSSQASVAAAAVGTAPQQQQQQAWMSPMPNNPNADQHNYTAAAASQTFDETLQNNQEQQHPGSSLGSLATARSSSLIPGDPAALHDQSGGAATPSYQPPQNAAAAAALLSPVSPNLQQRTNNQHAAPTPTAANHHHRNKNDTNNNDQTIDPDYLAACSASNLGRQESLFSQSSSPHYANTNNNNTNANINRRSKQTTTNAKTTNSYFNQSQYLDFAPTMVTPDATYEEEYGDAYIGGPIRYVYPSGYQSMRPRSGPWKLSIVVCMLFTWISVYIVGHCADYVDSDASSYNQNEIDDDTLVIETRWCGSRLLYMMWAISMLVTGLAAAYCSIIGYIKVRDFAVANGRSQPPGMMGKADYYAQIDDCRPPLIQETGSQGSFASSSHRNHYHVPIYQADGNPQFWGGHIYRPTQAAVAIASR